MLKTDRVAEGLFVDRCKHKIKGILLTAIRGVFKGKVTAFKRLIAVGSKQLKLCVKRNAWLLL